MATKDFSFLFYVNDFESGTVHMTDQELGCYLRLLLAQFKRDNLPDNPEFLKRFCDSFEQSWPIVKEKFIKGEDGFLQNKRMDFEKNKRKNYSESRSNNRRNNKSCDTDMNDISNSHEEHMINGLPSYENHMENENDYANGYVDDREGSMREGEPPKADLPPPFHKKFIVIEIVKIFRKAYPNDPTDSRDNESALLMAVKVTDFLKFPKNSFENEKTNDVLAYCEKIIKFSVGKPFFGNLPLYRMANEIPGLIKKYENEKNGTEQPTGTNGAKYNPKTAGAIKLAAKNRERVANYFGGQSNSGT